MNIDSRSRIIRLRDRLVECYGDRVWRGGLSAVGELVATILSQNTSDRNSSAGFRQLWRSFRGWNAVADGPVERIERCIRVCGLSNIKAPRIKAILGEIRRRHARLSLQFLRDWPAEQAYRYLLEFNGVGPKTAACVLLFAFGKSVFPVDTHIHRIAGRLGLVNKRASAQKTQQRLGELIPPGDRYRLHLLLIEHGRRTCHARRPACRQCPLRRMCPCGAGGECYHAARGIRREQ
jgi:endonuclease-3